MLLTDPQIYALFFLVGCFSVKSLLDLQNWASRKNLWELWIVFMIAMLGHDFLFQPSSTPYLAGKWGLLVVISLIFYFKDIDFIILDDKVAFLAALALLHPIMTPFFAIVYIGLILLFKKRLKHGFSHTKKIPTLPVLTTSLVFTVILFLFY